jgi:hypothetical protein
VAAPGIDPARGGGWLGRVLPRAGASLAPALGAGSGGGAAGRASSPPQAVSTESSAMIRGGGGVLGENDGERLGDVDRPAGSVGPADGRSVGVRAVAPGGGWLGLRAAAGGWLGVRDSGGCVDPCGAARPGGGWLGDRAGWLVLRPGGGWLGIRGVWLGPRPGGGWLGLTEPGLFQPGPVEGRSVDAPPGLGVCSPRGGTVDATPMSVLDAFRSGRWNSTTLESASAISFALGKRASGFSSQARENHLSNAGGTPSRVRDASAGGSPLSMRASSSAGPTAENGSRPVND